jgi:hypothetical protein
LDPVVFWSKAEGAELRWDSRLGRDIVVGLPHQLSDIQQQALLGAFSTILCLRWKTAVLEAKHRPSKYGDRRNDHGHLFAASRVVNHSGFGKKLRELDNPRTSGRHIEYLRSTWAELVNEAFQKAGLEIRVDHRSYERQELALKPGRPKGMALTWASRKLEALDQSILALGPSIDDLDEAQSQLDLVLRPAIGDVGGKSKKSTNPPIVSLDVDGMLQLNRDFSYLVAFLMRRLKRHQKLDRVAYGESTLLDACIVFVQSFLWVREKVRANKSYGKEFKTNIEKVEHRRDMVPDT